MTELTSSFWMHVAHSLAERQRVIDKFVHDPQAKTGDLPITANKGVFPPRFCTHASIPSIVKM